MISIAIKGFIDDFVNTRLKGFPITYDVDSDENEWVLFDPNISFDPVLRRYNVQGDVAFKNAQLTQNWLGILWNRDTVKGHPLGRTHKAVGAESGGLVDQYRFRFGHVTLSMILISPDMDRLEAVEESLYVVGYPEAVNISAFDTTFKVAVQTFEIGDFQFDEEQQFGSISGISVTAGLYLPIVVTDADGADTPVILTPESTVYIRREHDNYNET